jgi:hypothetical protein
MSKSKIPHQWHSLKKSSYDTLAFDFTLLRWQLGREMNTIEGNVQREAVWLGVMRLVHANNLPSILAGHMKTCICNGPD